MLVEISLDSPVTARRDYRLNAIVGKVLIR